MSYDENRISDQVDGGLSEKEEEQLRYDFEELAMNGFISKHGNEGIYDHLPEILYKVANDMLKARKENING